MFLYPILLQFYHMKKLLNNLFYSLYVDNDGKKILFDYALFVLFFLFVLFLNHKIQYYIVVFPILLEILLKMI